MTKSNEEGFLIDRFAERVFVQRQWLTRGDFTPGMTVRDHLIALLLEYRECVGWPPRASVAPEPPAHPVAKQTPNLADTNCKHCDGEGTIRTGGGRSDIYAGWRWCDCVIKNRKTYCRVEPAEEPTAKSHGLVLTADTYVPAIELSRLQAKYEAVAKTMNDQVDARAKSDADPFGEPQHTIALLRKKCENQTRLKVEAEMRAGRKNVAKLEKERDEALAKVAELEAINTSLYKEAMQQIDESLAAQSELTRAHTVEVERLTGERDAKARDFEAAVQNWTESAKRCDVQLDRITTLESELAASRERVAELEATATDDEGNGWEYYRNARDRHMVSSDALACDLAALAIGEAPTTDLGVAVHHALRAIRANLTASRAEVEALRERAAASEQTSFGSDAALREQLKASRAEVERLKGEVDCHKGVLQDVYATARLGVDKKAEALCDIMLLTQVFYKPGEPRETELRAHRLGDKPLVRVREQGELEKLNVTKGMPPGQPCFACGHDSSHHLDAPREESHGHCWFGIGNEATECMCNGFAASHEPELSGNPGEVPESPPAVREIRLKSTWHDSEPLPNRTHYLITELTVSLDNRLTVYCGHKWWTEAEFRREMTWVSDPPAADEKEIGK